MKCVIVMFDSLNRHHLPPYGCEWTHAPHFARLARRAATFDTSYVCSMPCMPARRDLHTGRPNFLHRSWGPLEPWDDSVFERLKEAGVYSHLTTDHYHYFEDGGATYHNRYSSWEGFRGQEGDRWKGQVRDPEMPTGALGRHESQNSPHPPEYPRQDIINRSFMPHEHQMPQAQTFAAGLDFIERNKNEDNWLLQIETFDPHEPFFSDAKHKSHYPYDPDALFFDWPVYQPVSESAEAVQHIRYEYAALLSQCDTHLGKVLNAFDKHNLWDDTLLVVWTDHGFLLGEHEAWAKIWMPFYEEVAHTPFFVHDPRFPQAAGQRRGALVQPSIDLAPTLLGFFGVAPTPGMTGGDLARVMESDTPVREAGIFGVHGAQVNVTDGQHVYMRGRINADNQPLFNYTMMPTTMRGFIGMEQLRQAEMAPPFPFTKGCPVMKIPAKVWSGARTGVNETLLWNVQADPAQKESLQNADVEAQMITHLTRLMHECDAPNEQYERLGLAGNPT